MVIPSKTCLQCAGQRITEEEFTCDREDLQGQGQSYLNEYEEETCFVAGG
jgi:hypothetical protein